MTRLNIAKAVAFLGVAGLAILQCAADTLVDTIGNGANYQIGKSLSRQISLGYDAYAFSGDFTGVRPFLGTTPVGGAFNYTFNVAPKSWDAGSQGAVWNVTHRGTTGVTTAQVLVNNVPSVGQYAAWVAQPFTPAASGMVSAVNFIAEYRTPAWYVPTFYGGVARPSTAYVGILDAQPAVGDTLPASVDLANCKTGTVVNVNVSKSVTAGQTYWLVIGPQATLTGQMDAGVLDYANLNWAWRTVASDIAKAGVPLYNGTNGAGDYVAMKSSVLGFRIIGASPQATTVANAKTLADGTLVSIADGAYISAKSNPDGLFYIEQTDRMAGIRVIGNAGLPVGEKVSLTGTITTVGAEKAITLSGSVTDLSASAAIAPYGMTSTSVGTLNSTGLVVKVWGSVKNAAGSEFDLVDGANTAGVHVRIIDSTVALPGNGSYVSATGPASKEDTTKVLATSIFVYAN